MKDSLKDKGYLTHTDLKRMKKDELIDYALEMDQELQDTYELYNHQCDLLLEQDTKIIEGGKGFGEFVRDVGIASGYRNKINNIEEVYKLLGYIKTRCGKSTKKKRKTK